jgi:hypothetical protein
MLDHESTMEFVQAFQTRLETGIELEECACQVFPEVANNDVHRELVESLMAEVIQAFEYGGPDVAIPMLGHSLTVAIAFGLGYGATDAITDDSGDYSWALTDSDLEFLSREDFLGD